MAGCYIPVLAEFIFTAHCSAGLLDNQKLSGRFCEILRAEILSILTHWLVVFSKSRDAKNFGITPDTLPKNFVRISSLTRTNILLMKEYRLNGQWKFISGVVAALVPAFS
jgi:hypothetical protein